MFLSEKTCCKRVKISKFEGKRLISLKINLMYSPIKKLELEELLTFSEAINSLVLILSIKYLIDREFTISLKKDSDL